MVKYILRWDDEKFNYRYWESFGSGFTKDYEKARVFDSMKQASIEADNIFESQKRGVQIRPLNNATRRDYARIKRY